jgi:hypothetical protein
VATRRRRSPGRLVYSGDGSPRQACNKKERSKEGGGGGEVCLEEEKQGEMKRKPGESGLGCRFVVGPQVRFGLSIPSSLLNSWFIADDVAAHRRW